jgi:hypothetical protein
LFKLTREGCRLQEKIQAPRPGPLPVWRGEGDKNRTNFIPPADCYRFASSLLAR